MSEVKATLQLTGKQQAYLRLRKELAGEMAAVDWQNKMQSRERLWRTWVNCRGEDTEASSAFGTAFQALIADVGAKERKSAGAGDRQFWVPVADEADNEDDHEDDEASILARPPIHLHTVDPDATDITHGQYPWSGPGNRPAYMGVLAHLTMYELVNLSKKHMPEGRAVRAIFGATENPPAASGTDVPFGNPAHIQLTDAEEVEAWVASSNARPLRAQVVLQSSPRLLDISSTYLRRFPDPIVTWDPKWSRDHIWTAEERASLDHDPESDDDGSEDNGSEDVQDDEDDENSGECGDGAGTSEGAEGVTGGTGAVVGDAEGIVGGAEGAAGGADGVAGGAETGGGGSEGSGAGTAQGGTAGSEIRANEQEDFGLSEEEHSDA
ncbi:hypothetical protein Q9L58_009706 [Maublancomyces gigas]|uniref:Uncharacterized protein n=1 Tax=Discina gigas TaxID=1032678 RepID=A0ABR3G6J7_9PEZI